MDYIEEIIKTGFDRNVLCFDTKAKRGELTKALIEIMIKYSKTKINTILLPEYTENILPNDFKNNIKVNHNIEIKFNLPSSATYFFEKELKGSLYTDDEELVVGFDSENLKNVCLGSY